MYLFLIYSLIQFQDVDWELQRKSLIYLTNASVEHGKFIWTGG